jgi:YidC/Oxa1 family membrane protein insertase
LDQRRFISFLMISVGVLILFSILFPPPPPAKKPAQPAAAQNDAKQEAEKPADDAAAGANQAAQGEQAQNGAPAANAAAQAPVEAPLKLLSLGSLDPASGYRMLATFTSRGGGVLRTELASPRYRDQHDRSGYLGELELKEVDGGLEVQVVGAGTPAAAVGIAAGDVIVGVGNGQAAEIKKLVDLSAALAKTEPGQQITLQVRRAGGPSQARTVKLMRRPFAVLRPEADNYKMREAELPPNFVDPPSFLMTLAQQNGKPLSEESAKLVAAYLETGNWEVAAADAKSVSFRRTLPEFNLEIFKRYSLQPVPANERDNVDYAGYHLQLDIELRNTAQSPQTFTYRLDGPTGMPLEGWWYAHKISRHWFASAGLRDIVVRLDDNPVHQVDCPAIAGGKSEPISGGEALAYAGVDGQYFAAVMIPIRQALKEAWFDVIEGVVAGTKPDARTPVTYTNVTCRMTRLPIELAAGASRTDSFQVFIGPKRPNLLANYQAAGDPNHSLKDIVYYGLALFGAVAQLMLGILHFFYGLVGNYGAAIVMLTILVRGAMFPISYKQTKNMARMQALKPEMDRISEKYKTDMQKRSQAIQELYRKHNINPLGGCLPVFLQLPIFIGLYRALMVDVELRLSPLISDKIRWCSNLAAPDMFYDWSWLMPKFITSGQGIFGLGPYLNVLPIVTVALFLVTQKMAMPAPTNEQAAMQQKMMKWMTVFMGLLFYKVASGLCLYFIASSLWGIGERKLLPKSQSADASAAGGATGSPPGSSGKRPGGNGGPRPGSNGSPDSKKPRKAKRRK